MIGEVSETAEKSESSEKVKKPRKARGKSNFMVLKLVDADIDGECKYVEVCGGTTMKNAIASSKKAKINGEDVLGNLVVVCKRKSWVRSKQITLIDEVE